MSLLEMAQIPAREERTAVEPPQQGKKTPRGCSALMDSEVRSRRKRLVWVEEEEGERRRRYLRVRRRERRGKDEEGRRRGWREAAW
jgi:hypothetical protein